MPEAVEKLLGKPVGTYLIRFSSTGMWYNKDWRLGAFVGFRAGNSMVKLIENFCKISGPAQPSHNHFFGHFFAVKMMRAVI